ncbi:hypothetical protein ACFVSW_27205 [Neobacillus sp. NPDC058068]|uniref:hypothetical protein n=1 Tax=Neobacillus sp. NPDC058068 TaxID=3346325 RepID=UPI0036D99EDC
MKKFKLLILIFLSTLIVLLIYGGNTEKVSGGKCLGKSVDCKQLGDSYYNQLKDIAFNFTLVPIALEGENSMVLFPLVNYSIKNDSLVDTVVLSFDPKEKKFVEDADQHKRIWKTISLITPTKAKSLVKQFYLGLSEKSRLLGEVTPISDDLKTWKLMINMNDIEDSYVLIHTINHETGHLLTLNDSQILPFKKQCNTYLSDYGCSKPSSYINLFYEAFWKGKVEDDWRKMNPKSDEQFAEFYDKHPNEFINPYAASSIYEDIAESWNAFVFNEKIKGKVPGYEEKINFFYQFPELVQMRAEILNNVMQKLQNSGELESK